MKPWVKIAVGILLLLISFDGLRIAGSDALGPTAAALFAAIGVILPFVIGLLIRRKLYRGPGAVGDALLSMWPLCVMRVWPVMAGLKQWDYSYIFAASERDVVGFLLFSSTISVWSLLSAKALQSWHKSQRDESEYDDKFRYQKGRGYELFEVVTAAMLGIFILLALTLGCALFRHASFHSKAWDLAIFAQLAYNITHGNGLEVSVRGLESIFADHFQPIMFPVAWLHQLFGGKASALIIIQAVAIATGIVPIMLIMHLRNPNYPEITRNSVYVYFMYVPLAFLLLDDFHPIAFVVPLFLWAFYFFEIKRMWPFCIFLIIAGCCQEEVWIIVGMVGLYLALFHGMRKAGFIMFFLSWLFFFWLVVAFIPSFRAEGDYFYIHRYAYLGSSPGEIAKNIFLHPGLWLRRMFDGRSIAFIFMMLAPLGFLPLRRPKILFMIIPVAFYTLISGYDIQKSIFHQYTAPFIPFLILAYIDNFRTENNKSLPLNISQISIGGFLCASFAFIMMLNFPILKHEDIYWYQGTRTMDAANSGYLLNQISEHAGRISTISKYAPHLTDREYLTLFPQLDWEGQPPDSILVDGKELINEEDRRELAEITLKVNHGPSYDRSFSLNGIFLFDMTLPPADISSAPPYVTSVAENLQSNPDDLMNVEKPKVDYPIQIKAATFVDTDWKYHNIHGFILFPGSYPYLLKLLYTTSDDLTPDWFLAIRAEDASGRPVVVYSSFPFYGMCFNNKAEAESVFGLDTGKYGYGFFEIYFIDNYTYELPHYNPLYKYYETGPPVTLRILPMRLPEGWTNTLDEYVTNQEYRGTINWDNAYTVDLKNSWE